MLYEIDGMPEIAICMDCNQRFDRYRSTRSDGSEVIRFIDLHNKNADIVNNVWLCTDPPKPRIVLL